MRIAKFLTRNFCFLERLRCPPLNVWVVILHGKSEIRVPNSAIKESIVLILPEPEESDDDEKNWQKIGTDDSWD